MNYDDKEYKIFATIFITLSVIGLIALSIYLSRLSSKDRKAFGCGAQIFMGTASSDCNEQ